MRQVEENEFERLLAAARVADAAVILREEMLTFNVPNGLAVLLDQYESATRALSPVTPAATKFTADDRRA